MSALALAPDIDASALAARFACDRRVQVKPIVTADAAAALHHCLDSEITWQTVFNDRGRNYDLHPTQIEAMGADKYRALMGHVLTQAKDRFQYLYEGYPVYDAVAAGTNAHPILGELLELLNGAAFLNLVRRITGFSDVAYCDAHATCYGPGHFLTEHDDDVAGKNRRAAYVLNLTPYWRADWGGNLLFFDQADNITGGLVPTFNALNIFAVPLRHAVSYVAPFAGRRYAVTGWLRAR